MNSSTERQKEIKLVVLYFSNQQQQQKVVKEILQKKKKRKKESKVKDIPREKEQEHGQREPIHIFEE